ncbi:MAG: hypothetical protein AAFX85_12775 [Pseudomonadota bacterium]
MSRGTCPAYLLSGLELAHRYAGDVRFSDNPTGVRTCRRFPTEFYAALFAQMESDGEEIGGWRVRALWALWATCPGSHAFVAQLQGSQPLSAATLRCVIQTLDALRWFEPSTERLWSTVGSRVTSWARQLRAAEALPVAQAASVWCAVVRAGIAEWAEVPSVLASIVADVEKLASRLAQIEEFVRLQRSPTVVAMLELVAGLPAEERGQLLSSDAARFVAFASVGSYEGARQCIAWAAGSLARVLPGLTLDAWHSYPRKLARVLQPLGALSRALRTEVCAEASAHPLMLPLAETPPPTAEAFASAVIEISRRCGDSISSPFPRKARLDPAALSPGQRVRAWMLARKRIVLSRLELLEQCTWQMLERGFNPPTRSKSTQNALALLRENRTNRRALRKLLHAHWSHQRDFVRTHPTSVEWISKHRRYTMAVWFSTSEKTMYVDGKEVTLALEHDPIEVLAMGTYVGTCYGMGGMCSESPAAVVLDVNKNVVYARDASGRVIGRQLLALADDGRLVGFEVYPATATESLAGAFRKFARGLASEMEVPVFGWRDEEHLDDHFEPYEISSLLSTEWYDDGAANLLREELRVNSQDNQ